ncbi:MAG TPA: flagellar biosynthetic protein FliR [Phycisphaerae bacterium]|nr:flagellar biosynthetic protein FliR [Phycisphaerae bacterium]
MDAWIRLFLPFGLLLARIGAFVAVLPIFSWQALPVRVRAAIAVVVTVFFAAVRAPVMDVTGLTAASAAVVMVQEVLYGLALGLAVSFVFLAVQQGGEIIGMQMGLGDAGILDPVTGETAQPIGMFFEVTFILLFLAAGGHHLFLLLIDKSYQVFPAGAALDRQVAGRLAEALVSAGAAMLLMALRIAAPVLAAFVLLSVVLGILARVLPEMNILMTSFPLRVGMGLLMAAMALPSLDHFAGELGRWINTFFVT